MKLGLISILLIGVFWGGAAHAILATDTDNDGVSDSQDVDADGDGLIEISTLDELNNIRYNLAGTAYNDGESDNSTGCGNNDDVTACNGYELSNDLDFDTNSDGVMDGDDTYWNAGEGWLPMGAGDNAFTAILDGNDFSINNLYIDRSSTAFVALFAYADGATIQNISLGGDLMSITGSTKVAGFIGITETENKITFSNCYVSGEFSGRQYVASLIGEVYDVSVVNSHSDATINSTYGITAGLIAGSFSNTVIQNSSFIGQITNVGGNANVAGLVGEVVGGLTIENSFVMADISSDEDWVGGLIGYIWKGTSASITNSFFSGTLNGDDVVGGLVGTILENTDLTLTSSYSSAVITANSNAGGLVGSIDGTSSVTDGFSYWDSDITTQTVTVDNAGTGYSTSELKTPTTNTGIYANWDNTIWDLGTSSQYPALIINSKIYRDTDSDGLFDFEDDDDDGDGIDDSTDVDDDGDGLIEISTLDELNNIRYNLSGTAYNDGESDDSTGCGNNHNVTACNGYELNNDLDFDTNADGFMDANDTYWNGGEGWTPVGDSSNPFTAIFNGNDYSIYNLFINNTSLSAYVGLFGYAQSTTIKNLHLSGSLTSVTASSASFVGGIVGRLATSGTIETLSYTGDVTGNVYVGGIAGQADGVNLENCFAVVNVTGGYNVGGIAGVITSSSSVTENNFSLGTVAGSSAWVVGGLYGNFSGSISNSFSRASVSGDQTIGGLVGILRSSTSTVENSYSTGLVAGNSDFGGLVGIYDPSTAATDSYWDTENSNQTVSGTGVGYSQSNLQIPTSNTGIYTNWSSADWDFGSSSQYPALIINSIVYRDADGDGYFAFEDAFDDDATEYLDSDNDGTGDNADAFPNDATETTDADGDGVGDNSDTSPYFAGEFNLEFPNYTVSENGSSINITITRSESDYGELNIDYALQDGSAVATTDYVSQAGTLSFSEGIDSQTITLDIVNNSEYSGDKTFTITLSNVRGVDDATGTIGANAAATIIIEEDEAMPAAGGLAFAASTYSVSEDAGSIVVNVTRSGGSYGEVSIDYATSDNTASASNDYLTSSGTLTFLEGETSQDISIALVDNSNYEVDETFTVQLSNLQSNSGQGDASLGADTVTITIVDDESVPASGALDFASSNYSVAENGSSLEVTIERTGGDYGEVSVDVITADTGSASAGDDYESISQNIIFVDGETTQIITLTVNDDSDYEGDESLNLSLENVIGTVLGSVSTTSVTITEDDAIPDAGVLQFSGDTYSVAENTNELVITVTRTNGSYGELTVDVTSAANSATQNDDFDGVEQTLTFLDGDTNQTLILTINDDSDYEEDERFTLSLSNLTGDGALGSPATATITIEENDAVPAAGILQLSGSSYSVNEGDTNLVLTVIRTGGSYGEVSVDYSFNDASAISGRDVNAIDGTLYFSDGDTSQTITLEIIDDNLDESSEVLSVLLSNPSGTTLGAIQQASIKIEDNDEAAVTEDEEEEIGVASMGMWWLFAFVLLFLPVSTPRRKTVVILP